MSADELRELRDALELQRRRAEAIAAAQNRVLAAWIRELLR